MAEEKTMKLTLVGGNMSKGGFAEALIGRENPKEDAAIVGAAFYTTEIRHGDTLLKV